MSDTRSDSDHEENLFPYFSDQEYIFPRIKMKNKKNRKRGRPLADSPVSPTKGRGPKEPRGSSGVKTPDTMLPTEPLPSTSQSSGSAPSHSAWFTPNPFSSLSTADVPSPQSNSNDYIHKPPPIFIRNVTNFSEFIKTFSGKFGKDSFICKAMADKIKINFHKTVQYREAVHFLRALNVTFHTYEVKDDKAFRVVLRHLHPTTSVELIKEELEEKGFLVRRVTNVLKQTTKEPLPLFFVDLEPSSNNTDIFKVNSLVYCRIKVEEPYKKREIVQCKRCQEYGHTKTYCNYIPKCVKCADCHLSEECPKPRDYPKKCVLCGSNHTANYRGCNVHKNLQQRMKGTNSRPTIAKDIRPQGVSLPTPQEGRPSQLVPTSQQVQKTISYAAITRGQTTNPPPIVHIPPPPAANDLTTFLSEFKSLISPLISLLTTVMSTLLPALAQLNPVLSSNK